MDDDNNNNKKIKCKIYSRDEWTNPMIDLFGPDRYGSIHELTHEQIVEAIIKCGRAEITHAVRIRPDSHDLDIDFQTDYD
jgi:hypothetical protein